MGVLQDLADAESQQFARWEQQIQRLLDAKGGTVTPAEFQRAVNVIYHDVEAASYDELHAEMWDSLQPIVLRLAQDIESCASPTDRWTLADIGCGTGLATELVLRSPLRSRIAGLKMVDTSAEMLDRCRDRAKAWDLPADFVHGGIDKLPDACAEFLVTSSVLHHLPDLVSFCGHVERTLRPGGFFVHMQDPQHGALQSQAVVERTARLAAARRQNRLQTVPLPKRIIQGVATRVRRVFTDEHGGEYVEEVNRRLISAGLVKKPLTAREIWSITDLRVGDLPYAAADGICIDDLAVALPRCDRIATRTYCFFATMPSNLPTALADEERRLFEESSGAGAYLAGVWRRRD